MKRLLDRLMAGRYGADRLGTATLALAALLFLAGLVFRFPFLRLAGWFPALTALYRFLSRDIRRRRAENDRFITVVWPWRKRVLDLWNRLRRRTHRCPTCGRAVRLRKGSDLCPRCGSRIDS